MTSMVALQTEQASPEQDLRMRESVKWTLGEILVIFEIPERATTSEQ